VTTLARTAVLPFDHLAAELVAFPLCSEAALTMAVTHLDPTLDADTGRLWRAAERDLVTSSPGMSLDELTAMRDDCWFAGLGRGGDPRQRPPRPLHHHLADAARRPLAVLEPALRAVAPPVVRGPQTPGPPYAQARSAWMWLTFALPADLLLALCGRPGWIPERPPLSPPIRDLLARGFAETHLHAGASLDFATVWSMLMARIASPQLPRSLFLAPGAVPAEGTTLADWLMRAAIARTALAWFLTRGSRASFVDFLFGPFRKAVVERAGHGTFRLVHDALADLCRGTLSDTSVPLLRGAYADLIGSSSVRRPDAELAALRRVDPITDVLDPGTRTPEQCLIVGMTGYLDRRDRWGSPDAAAAVLFWQVTRVRVLVYRHLTQRPLTPGLPWFIRFYDRMSKVRGPVSPCAVTQAATRTSGVEEGLTSLEIRTSPDAGITELRQWTRTLHREQRRSAGADHLEIGIVFHFLKIRGGEVAKGVAPIGGNGSHADPSAPANTGRCRFANYFTDQLAAARTLARQLQQWPHTQLVVRGLDVCADELAVPSWVLRPLLHTVRSAAANGLRYLRRQGGRPPPPLRTTVHAGEDFAHLLTGLRHVHEAIEDLDLHEGDRIGHGLALGVDPQVWSRRVGRAALPLQDRVFDLAWEWSWWTRRGGGSDAGRLAYLASEVADLAEEWFGCPVDIRQVARLRSDLVDPLRLAASGFPDELPGKVPDPRPADRLIDRYLRDAGTFHRGMTTVLVDPSGEVDALSRIGVSLREEVSRRALAIEINPTSNLLIGDLTDLGNHPLWRLAPPRPDPQLPPLSVTIGSDDPLVFNCRLPEEYQLLFDAMIMAGLTDTEAMAWLDRARRNGLERRFTTPVHGVDDPFEVENYDELDPDVDLTRVVTSFDRRARRS
jgi:hypothetical protein